MEKFKKAIVVTNGEIKDPDKIKKHLKYFGFGREDLVISADGGAKNAIRLGLDTRLLTGDMDSIDEEVRENLKSGGAEFVLEPLEKDYTDTHLALRQAIKKGAEQIIILAAIGDRVDHSLANLLLLADPFLSGTDVRIITETEEIFVVRKPVRLEGSKGRRLSLFSLTPYTLFRESRGLKYGLKNEKLLFSPIRGVSNEFTQDSAYLGIKEGILLVIKEL
ncbi:MAG: thiamine diphosphokinase [Actinomycetota bacterium]